MQEELSQDFLIEDGVLRKYRGKEQEVIIPDSVKEIYPHAFCNCRSVLRIVIPKGLTGQVWCEFTPSDPLKEFVVDPENPAYVSREGLLYNKEQTQLIRCPPGITGHMELPDSVTRIGDSAFRACNLTTISLPSGLRSIGDQAFMACLELQRLEIPDGVEEIGAVAFGDCWSLKYVHLPEDAYIAEESCLFLGAFPKMTIDGGRSYYYGIDQGDSW